MNKIKETRLNKHIAQMGFCSRREADKIIFEGRVYVNGEKEINPGRKINNTNEKVTFDFDIKSYQKKKTYLKLFKPKGYVVSTQKKEGPTVYELIGRNDLSPIGRLDKDSSGLLLFTDDGSLTKKIIGEKNGIEKEYIVKVAEAISDKALKMLSGGMKVQGVMTKRAKVKRLSGRTFSIILKEGRNRQIRRMCKNVGHPVLSLKRIRIGNILLKGLTEGKCEELKEEEINSLKNL